MCTYCMVGDHQFRFNPPWPQEPQNPWHPHIPSPINPFPVQPPWSLEQLKEFQDLLKRVKDLEDKLGCPCEPNKADYIELFRQRIEQLEKRVAEK